MKKALSLLTAPSSSTGVASFGDGTAAFARRYRSATARASALDTPSLRPFWERSAAVMTSSMSSALMTGFFDRTSIFLLTTSRDMVLDLQKGVYPDYRPNIGGRCLHHRKHEW